jgi:anhydro-N-acetylmuramic acid kinase
MKNADALFLGLMSGTSMDGIDAAIVRLGDRRCDVIASNCAEYSDAVRSALRSLRDDPDACTIDDIGRLDTAVGKCFAAAANEVLDSAHVRREDIVAIGSHGQTLRHHPNGKLPYTMQVGDPNIIASQTGITVVADFRRADLAVGGQGAPLAPAFHKWLFADNSANRAVLNLGGIANVTIIPVGDGPVVGFDTGPANILLDAWIRKHLGRDYDQDGSWAAHGKPAEQLLDALLQDNYFSLMPPKSTGFEYFNLAWLESKVAKSATVPSHQDVQATLVELTCRSVSEALRRHAPTTSEIFVCGGGIHNLHLCVRLAANLPGVRIDSTAVHGLDPDWVEASAFAWLAKCRIEGVPGNLPSVTGASRPAVLGGVYCSTH